MLSINIWDLLWTFVDFFLLYFILKKLLYDPLISFMEARRERIEGPVERERLAREAVEAGQARVNGEKEQCRAQARDILGKARAELGRRQERIASETRQESRVLRQKLQGEAERQSADDGQRLRQSEAELAGLLADRLLRRQ